MTEAEFEQFNLPEQAKLIYKKGVELMEYEQVFLIKYKKIFTLYALGNLYIESESIGHNNPEIKVRSIKSFKVTHSPDFFLHAINLHDLFPNGYLLK